MRLDLPRIAAVMLSFFLAVSAFGQTTVTLQQGVNGYAGTTDTHSFSDIPDGNFGNRIDWAIGLAPASYMPLMRFAIFASEGGPVPDGAAISSATLTLNKTAGGNQVVQVRRLLRSWNELQATWDVAATGASWQLAGAQGANDVAATAEGQGTIGAAAGAYDIDVTASVQAFAAGAPNFGWRFGQVSGTNDNKTYVAHENASVAQRPKLTVTYTTGSTTVTLQDGVNGYAGTTDTHSFSDIPDGNFGNRTDWAIGLAPASYMPLMRFAIFASEGGPVPNGATINSATLTLNKTAGGNQVVQVRRLLRSWNELQANWNVAATGASWQLAGAQGANDVAATAEGQGTIGAAAGAYDIDVTASVQAFAAGAPNFGWRFGQVSGTNDNKTYVAHENASVAQRPKLTVTYGGTPNVPIAQLTATPMSGTPSLNVTFNASATTDSGSPITGLRLVFGDGSSDATWSDKNQTQLHTYNTVGTYTATLTATNANGTSAPATRTITVTNGPVGPTAAFTATPSLGTEPLTVAFNASGSTQGSSAITSLRLQFGHNAQEVTWSDKNVSQSYTYPAGTFTATLTVTDANNLTNSTTRTIQVDPAGTGEIQPNLTTDAGDLGFSVPTFHSMGLYYNPASVPANCTTSNGSGCKIWMRYRKATEPNTAWREGYPMWFDPRTTGTLGTLPFTVNNHQYRARGSAVLLQPGIKYFFQFGTGTSFATASWQHHVAGTTWSETFPEDPVKITIPSRTPADGAYVISAGGTAGAYKVYDGWNGTSKNVINRGGANTESDLGTDASKAIVVKANFVIVRRVRVTAAASAGIFIAPNVTDVVIEDAEVDDWSSRPGVDHATTDPEPNPNSWGTWGVNEAGGIHLGGNNSRIVMQRNVIKAPHFGAFPWDTSSTCTWGPGITPAGPRNHPIGPMGISIQQAGQQNVIRYNEITGDAANRHKWYLDAIGGGENFSDKGVPGADSDIYQNIIMHAFDDAIEAEGGGRNVRILGNYASDTNTGVATTAVHFGPTYIWRNVVNRIRACYQLVADSNPGADWPATVFKAGGFDEGYGNGARYFFHNTILQQAGAFGAANGFEPISNGSGSVAWTIARNNILQMRDESSFSWSIQTGDTPAGSEFTFNLYNGRIDEHLPAPDPAFRFTASQLIYKAGNGPSSVPSLGGGAGAGIGNYQLDTTSKGLNVGQVVPNFSDGFLGAAPDVGAHENGSAPMKFGISAGQ